MTNLELAICEAEHYGDIDIDTRDILLDVINESTARARYAERENKKLDRYSDLMGDFMKRMRQKYNISEDDPTSKLKDKMNERELEMYKKLSDGMGKSLNNWGDNYNAYKAHRYGKWAARFKSGDKWAADEYSMNGMMNARQDPWRGKSKREPEVKGKYKTTKGLKESVDDILLDIYEAELNGEITIEEREALLEELDSVIDD